MKSLVIAGNNVKVTDLVTGAKWSCPHRTVYLVIEDGDANFTSTNLSEQFGPKVVKSFKVNELQDANSVAFDETTLTTWGETNLASGAFNMAGAAASTTTIAQKLLTNPISAAAHGALTGSGSSAVYETIDGEKVVTVNTGVGSNAILNLLSFPAQLLPNGELIFGLYIENMALINSLTFEVSDNVNFTGNVYKCQVSNSSAFNFRGWHNICIAPPAEGEWNDLGAVATNVDRRWQPAAGSGANGAALFTASISGNVMTVTGSPSGATLTSGMTVNAPGVRAGTKIVSGAGGPGDYVLDGAAQTVASIAMTASKTLSFDKTKFTNVRVTIAPQAGVSGKVSFAEVSAGQRNNKSLCAITVDDGYSSFYTYMAPLLESFGFVGNMGIIASQIGVANYLTAAQITDLVARGHRAMPHGVTSLSALANQAAMLAEIQANQAPIIENGWNVDDSVHYYIVPNSVWAENSGANTDDSRIKGAMLQAGVKGIRASGYCPVVLNKWLKKIALPWLPEIGHRADLTSDAAETANIKRNQLKIKQACRQRRYFIYTFHNPIDSTNGVAQTSNIDIQVQNLTSILQSLKDEVDAGRLEVVILPKIFTNLASL
jgi:hypothetical protein